MSRTCLITGGSSGIGLELARQLADQGQSIVILGRDRQKLDSAQENIRTAGGCCRAFSADVREFAALAEVAGELSAAGGTIDFLIVNAGIIEVDTIHDMTFDRMAAVLQTNLLGAVATVKAFLPLMPARSRILFISSAFGLVGAAGYAAYCASKGGLDALAEAVQREVRCRGIVVQVARLTDIDTPQYAHEVRSKPGWMIREGIRTTPMPVGDACRRILAGCRSNRFFIFISPDVRLLYHLTHLLPREFRDWLMDRLLPRPI